MSESIISTSGNPIAQPPSGRKRPLSVVRKDHHDTSLWLSSNQTRMVEIPKEIERWSGKEERLRSEMFGSDRHKARNAEIDIQNDKCAKNMRRLSEERDRCQNEVNVLKMRMEHLEKELSEAEIRHKEAMAIKERKKKAAEEKAKNRRQSKASTPAAGAGHISTSEPKYSSFFGAKITKPPKIRREVLKVKPTNTTLKRKAVELERQLAEQKSKNDKPSLQRGAPSYQAPTATMTGAAPSKGTKRKAGDDFEEQQAPHQKQKTGYQGTMRPQQASMKERGGAAGASRRSTSRRTSTQTSKKRSIVSKKSSSTSGTKGGISAAPSKFKGAVDNASAPTSNSNARTGTSSGSNGSKKRRHPDEDENEDEAEAEDERKSKKLKLETTTEPTGLSRRSNECFSNATIQCFDAALEGHDADGILGKVVDVETFGTDEGSDMKSLRGSVKAAAANGEGEKVSISLHLRKLLACMHDASKPGSDAIVSPKLFQQVVAYRPSDDGNLEHMNGDTQQDCHEYYQKVLNGLIADGLTADKDALKALFEVETTKYDSCSKCDYESKPQIATDNYHNVNVPMDDPVKPVPMSDLFESSLQSLADDACPECGKSTLYTHTEFDKHPENFVLRLNRNLTTRSEFKIQSKVGFVDHLDVDGNPYNLSAIIMHDGRKALNGHYRIFRKYGEQWYLIDDAVCKEQDWKQVTDRSRTAGHSAMMLFKKSPQ